MGRKTYLFLMGMVFASTLLYVLNPPHPQVLATTTTDQQLHHTDPSDGVSWQAQISEPAVIEHPAQVTTHRPTSRQLTTTPRKITDTAYPPLTTPHHPPTTLASTRSTPTTHAPSAPKKKPPQLPRLMPLRDAAPERTDANVFLVDSANNTHPSFRAWCGVESWARENPQLDVHFLLTASSVDNSDLLPLRLLRQYPNLRLATVPLTHMFSGTPLFHLFTSYKWRTKSAWPVNELSDMLRVLFLWQWGGVYSDTDVICLKAFNLNQNAVGFFTKGGANNGLMSFSRRHKFLFELMEDMKKNYRPGVWGVLGPQAVTRMLRQWCGASRLAAADGQTQLSCGSISVVPQSHFYPVPWQLHHTLTQAPADPGWRKRLNGSLVLHMWNKLSKNSAVKAGGESIYDKAARAHCPLTYRQATLRSTFF